MRELYNDGLRFCIFVGGQLMLAAVRYFFSVFKNTPFMFSLSYAFLKESMAACSMSNFRARHNCTIQLCSVRFCFTNFESSL